MTAPVFNRPDTLLGVCEAIGQDLGFDPLWLRIALAVGALWNPWAMAVAYVGLGAAVVLARMVTPERKVEARPVVTVPEAGNDDDARIVLAEAA